MTDAEPVYLIRESELKFLAPDVADTMYKTTKEVAQICLIGVIRNRGKMAKHDATATEQACFRRVVAELERCLADAKKLNSGFSSVEEVRYYEGRESGIDSALETIKEMIPK